MLPGQENVIPGQAEATFEMRHMDKTMTDQLFADIKRMAEEIPDCTFEFSNSAAKYSTPCDPRLIRLIDQVCEKKNIRHVIMPSGAFHDANPMAQKNTQRRIMWIWGRTCCMRLCWSWMKMDWSRWAQQLQR